MNRKSWTLTAGSPMVRAIIRSSHQPLGRGGSAPRPTSAKRSRPISRARRSTSIRLEVARSSTGSSARPGSSSFGPALRVTYPSVTSGFIIGAYGGRAISRIFALIRRLAHRTRGAARLVAPLNAPDPQGGPRTPLGLARDPSRPSPPPGGRTTRQDPVDAPLGRIADFSEADGAAEVNAKTGDVLDQCQGEAPELRSSPSSGRGPSPRDVKDSLASPSSPRRRRRSPPRRRPPEGRPPRSGRRAGIKSVDAEGPAKIKARAPEKDLVRRAWGQATRAVLSASRTSTS